MHRDGFAKVRRETTPCVPAFCEDRDCFASSERIVRFFDHSERILGLSGRFR
jgi:hypothetical protein